MGVVQWWSASKHAHLLHGFVASLAGFHYLPVDRATYLTLQHFVNSLMLSLAPLHHGIFLYNGRLVRAVAASHALQSPRRSPSTPQLFSTLPHSQVRIMFKYLRMHCASVLHHHSHHGASRGAGSARRTTAGGLGLASHVSARVRSSGPASPHSRRAAVAPAFSVPPPVVVAAQAVKCVPPSIARPQQVA